MQLFLGGTTAGTTWRPTLIADGIQAGIPESRFFNPHLKRKPGQTGPLFTPEARQRESAVKRSPHNLVLFYICPGVVKNTDGLTPEQIVHKSEQIGLFTVFEATKMLYTEPHRVALVIDLDRFQEGGTVRRRLKNIADEIVEDFTDEKNLLYQQLYEQYPGNRLPDGSFRNPLYSSLDAVKEWAFPFLLNARD